MNLSNTLLINQFIISIFLMLQIITTFGQPDDLLHDPFTDHPTPTMYIQDLNVKLMFFGLILSFAIPVVINTNHQIKTQQATQTANAKYYQTQNQTAELKLNLIEAQLKTHPQNPQLIQTKTTTQNQIDQFQTHQKLTKLTILKPLKYTINNALNIILIILIILDIVGQILMVIQRQSQVIQFWKGN